MGPARPGGLLRLSSSGCPLSLSLGRPGSPLSPARPGGLLRLARLGRPSSPAWPGSLPSRAPAAHPLSLPASLIAAFSLALGVFCPDAHARVDSPMVATRDSARIVTLTAPGVPPTEFIRIAPGRFRATVAAAPGTAAAPGEAGSEVELETGYWLARAPVDEAYWAAALGLPKPAPALADKPVTGKTDAEVTEFLDRLQERVSREREGARVRIPSDVEQMRASESDSALSWSALRLAADGLEKWIDEGPVPLDVVTLAPGALLIRPETPIGNPTTIALLGDEETVLLDASIPGAAEAIDSMLVARGARPVGRVVTTHAHRDHVDGLVHWIGAGAVGIATKEQIEGIALSPVISAAVEGGRSALPTDVVEDERTIPFRMGGQEVEIHLRRPPNRSGHTNGDLLVHIPELGILYVGDYYFYDRFPIIGIGDGGSLHGYLDNLDWIAREFPASTLVLPGHNRFFPDPPALPRLAEFSAWRDRIRASIAEIRRIKESGADVETAVSTGLSEPYRGLSVRLAYVPEERWIRGVWETLE